MQLHKGKWDIFRQHFRGLADKSHTDNEEEVTEEVNQLETTIHRAIDKGIPWSKHNQKGKAWWARKNSLLKSQLAAARIASVPNREIKDYWLHEKQIARKWRREIRHTQWKYWENTNRGAISEWAFQAIEVADTRKHGLNVNVIQVRKDLQRKCQVIREAFFLTNVAPPLPVPAEFLAASKKDLSDTCR